MGRIVKMVCVTADNNNKAYNMIQESDSSWKAEWGRVGGSLSTKTYPMSQWDKMYRAKLKKGYRDITDLVSTAKEDETSNLEIVGAKPSVEELVNFLQSAAKGTISKNYSVSVADVTQKQVDTAQEILDQLSALARKRTMDHNHINSTLLEMYQVIPRHMSDTRKYLLRSDDTMDKFKRLLSSEQDLLDVMAGQVSTQSQPQQTNSSMDLGSLGLSFDEATDKDIDLIAKMTDLDVKRVGKIFVVSNGRTADQYDKTFKASPTSKEMLLYHGSRSANWWNIVNQGLKIRPSNAIHTGSMLGSGIYFANKARKSIGYTDLRGSFWANGSSDRAYIALFQVNTGKTWNIIGPGKRYEGWMSRISLSRVHKEGYDSVFARGGADLRNDEYVIYEEGRATVKYLIELRV